MPTQHGHLPGRGHGRDLEAPAGLDPGVESPERTRSAGGGERCFHEHAASLGPTGLRDPPVDGGTLAGLANLGVQAEIGDQLVGGGEPGEVPDSGNDREGHGNIDTRHRHQAGDNRIVDGLDGDVSIEDRQFVAVEVKLAQERVDASPFVGWQDLLGEPAAADTAEEITVRARRHEVPGQDPMYLVLESRALPD